MAGYSAELLAANQQLLALRAARAGGGSSYYKAEPSAPAAPSPSPFVATTSVARAPAVTTEVVTTSFATGEAAGGTAGWLAPLRARLQAAVAAPPSVITTEVVTAPAVTTSVVTTSGGEGVTLHPTLAAALLRDGLAGAGRVWLLLRALDAAGRGWLTVEAARHHLTNKQSNMRICGWRQLRNLLRQGQGVLWQRDATRIWLRAPARVAAALGVTRLSGAPVTMPAGALTAGIGTLRAHFYASHHSGRRAAQPISRAALCALTAVPERTQRDYERVAGVQAQPHYALGDTAHDATTRQAAGWQRGRALFITTDRRGRHGPAGARYLAWRLPNSYTGCHPRRPQSGTRRINRALKDLVNQRGQGNGGARVMRRYFADGATAARARRVGERYWPAVGAAGWWYVLAE